MCFTQVYLTQLLSSSGKYSVMNHGQRCSCLITITTFVHTDASITHKQLNHSMNSACTTTKGINVTTLKTMSKKSGQLHVSTSCDQLHEDLYITSLLAWLISLLRIYELCVLLSAITCTLNFSAMNKSACCSCNTCSPVGWHNTNIKTHSHWHWTGVGC